MRMVNDSRSMLDSSRIMELISTWIMRGWDFEDSCELLDEEIFDEQFVNDFFKSKFTLVILLRYFLLESLESLDCCNLFYF